jgi:hypothetical protein|tara:strand:- start:347 stop:679 length:333 start_codon:yes stop_codon:yes gene_type:complete
MSHFAKIDSNRIVTEVIVSEKDIINSGMVGDEFLWIQTSYNNNFRGKYAGIGDTWDKVNEVFISPQPYPSWSLGADFVWQAPVAMPEVADGVIISWDEDTTSWTETTLTP